MDALHVDQPAFFHPQNKKERKANCWSYGHNNITGYQLTLAQQPRHLGYLNANRVGLGGGVVYIAVAKPKKKRQSFFFLFKSFQRGGGRRPHACATLLT